MQRFLLGVVAALCLSLCSLAQMADTGGGGSYTFGAIASTGQLGHALSYLDMPSAPSSHTVEWSIGGTAPTACTLQLEGSIDGLHWYSLTGSLDCTTAQMYHVASKPVPFVRLNVLTYTSGGSTTVVTARYARSAQ